MLAGLRRRNMCTFVPSIVAIARPPDPASAYMQRCAVMHKNTTDGLEATRRLFTTLNKTAKPVSKNAVIALDEDDVWRFAFAD